MCDHYFGSHPLRLTTVPAHSGQNVNTRTKLSEYGVTAAHRREDAVGVGAFRFQLVAV